MSKLQRWSYVGSDEDSDSFETDPDGEWVKWEDVERELLATLGYVLSSSRFAICPPLRSEG